MGKLRVGMLTSGGDCPGLNATIRGAAKAIYEAFGEDKVEIVGIHDGYHGLIHGVYKVMQPSDFSGILTQGGTILGTKRRSACSTSAVSSSLFWDRSSFRPPQRDFISAIFLARLASLFVDK